jgi:hypothetical protein
VWYFRTPDGTRFPVDEKVQVVVEGVPHPLVKIDGSVSRAFALDVYETNWRVGRGTMGDDAQPCKVLVLEDSFSGAWIEVPIALEQAEQLAAALAPKRRRGWTRDRVRFGPRT